MYSDFDREMQRHKLWLELVKIINIIIVTVPFSIAWGFYYSQRLALYYGWKGILVVILLFVVLFIAFGRTYSSFRISVSSAFEIVYSQLLALFFTDAVLFFVIFLLAKRLPVLWPLLLLLSVQVIGVIIWSVLAHRGYYKRLSPSRTLIVWDMRESLADVINAYGMDKRFSVVNNLYVIDCIKNIPKALDGIDVVFLCGIHSHERNQIVKYCVINGIRAYVIPRIGDVIMSGAEPIQLFHLPMLALEKYNPSPTYLAIKRLFDIVASGLGLLILSPLLIIVAILIRRDGGTAFYKQVRLTKNGEKFELYKFRSMRMDAEKDGVARLSSGDKDDRITPIGRVIRKCRIDELPQLFNILQGTMSVVGPRPERPELAEFYQQEMPEFRLRLQTKAGLTGRAQVFGKYNTTPYDKLLMDLQYIANANIAEDLRIMFATIKILFLPESTEGVAVGQTTAMDEKKRPSGFSITKDNYTKDSIEHAR